MDPRYSALPADFRWGVRRRWLGTFRAALPLLFAVLIIIDSPQDWLLGLAIATVGLATMAMQSGVRTPSSLGTARWEVTLEGKLVTTPDGVFDVATLSTLRVVPAPEGRSLLQSTSHSLHDANLIGPPGVLEDQVDDLLKEIQRLIEPLISNESQGR